MGTYVATYTPPSNEPVGLHEIRWFYRLTADAPVVECRHVFEVTAGAVMPGPRYAAIADLREEGFTPEQVSDVRLEATIALASAYVERFTGRSFGAHYGAFLFNGRGSYILQLEEPIVGVESVAVRAGWNDDDFDAPLTPDVFRVYARHLHGQLCPDDRLNPKLELVAGEPGYASGLTSSYRRPIASGRPRIFLRGAQNVRLIGLLGYTEPDGSPWGAVPALIRHVTKLLVRREIAPISDVDAREDAQRRGRLTGESTREQSYTLAAPQTWANLTGDPEIDAILQLFARLPHMGAA